MATTSVDTNQLARLFDVTPRHIQRLTADGVLQRARDVDGTELRGRYELLLNVRAYVKYLRTQARLDDASESKYVQLRNQKMAAEAEQAELRLKLFKNTLHRAEDVEFTMTNMLTAFKSRILAIPSRVTRSLIGQRKFQVIYEILYQEIELALQELAGYDAAKFAQQSEAYLVSVGADPATLSHAAGNGAEPDDEGDASVSAD
jgi:phage terminase Nu1 subunit (DNA packaging protein)